MTCRISLRGAVALVWFGFVTGCGLIAPPAPSYRYKETVVVMTPQGIRTGSTVIGVQMGYFDFGSEKSLLPSAFKGQAVVVDLPDGQSLFALLTSPEHNDWAKTAYQYLIPQQPFGGELGLAKSPEYRQYQLAMALKGAQILPRKRGVVGHPGFIESGYPTMVRFRNIHDPATVEKVDPDDLAASFGRGYKLKQVILEKTDEPISGGIEKRYAWLGDSPEPRLKYPDSPQDWSFPATVSHGAFSSYGKYF